MSVAKNNLKVELLTTQALLLSQTAVSVNIPSTEGYLGIFSGHTSLLAKLCVGILEIATDNHIECFFIANGILHVSADKVKILADVAEAKDNINLDRATASKERAEQRLRNAYQTEIDIARANASLQRALARITFCN